MSHICKFCNKQYTRKFYYDRHVICCEILSKNKRERNIDLEEISDTPTLRQLYVLVQELGKQYAQLHEKMDTMTKYVENKKKKVSVIDWLNKNCIPKKTYSEWLETIVFKRSYLELVFKHDFIYGLGYILQEILPLTDEQNLPIRAFDQKENTLFICKKDNTWDTMSGEEFERLVTRLSRLLASEFKYWQDEHDDEFSNEKFSTLYTENVKKVMGGSGSRELIFPKIKRNLFKHLKANLKNIIQFEFTF